MRNAQISTEFLMLIGIAALLLTISLSFIADDMKQVTRDKEKNAIADLGYYLQNEIVVASKVSDGYSRVFSLPNKKDNIEYEITSYSNTSIEITTDSGMSREFLTPAFIGNFTKGENKIDKLGDIIYVNII